jgi:hypothetical protein
MAGYCYVSGRVEVDLHNEMGDGALRWLIQIACVATLTACPLSAHRLLRADDVHTGSFETTITERSPLSKIKSLAKRLKVINQGEKMENLQDYDLSKEGWWVYVPEKYDPAKPMGLIVLR